MKKDKNPLENIESMKRHNLRDGDVLVMTMAKSDASPQDATNIMRLTRNKIKALIDQLGVDAHVMVMGHGWTLEVITRELAKEYANSSSQDVVEENE